MGTPSGIILLNIAQACITFVIRYYNITQVRKETGMLSNVTSKGQVTIPAEIRSRFQIRPNDKIDFFVDGDRIIITPVRTLKQLRGSVAATGSGVIDEERKKAKLAVAERVAGEIA